MHCYACNGPVNPSKDLDTPTGRLYCVECFQPTLEEQMKLDLDGLYLSYSDDTTVVNLEEFVFSSEPIPFKSLDNNDSEDDHL